VNEEGIDLNGLSQGVKMEEKTRRLIYLSLLVVIVLAVLAHQTTQVTISAASLLLIVLIAISNIVYLHSKSKKSTTESGHT
jgi:lysylphosphatidylglycerol synthetase-like protein (DUF2156 family)